MEQINSTKKNIRRHIGLSDSEDSILKKAATVEALNINSFIRRSAIIYANTILKENKIGGSC